MEIFFPIVMISYLMEFRHLFTKPNWLYFQSYIFALMIVTGNKCVTRLKQASIFADRSLSSFQRFLTQYKWDLTEVLKGMSKLLIKEIGDQMKIYGSYLVALDTFLIAKSSKKMIGVQKWKDHSSNPDRGEYITGHHWAIAGFISSFLDRFLCWPMVCRLICGEKEPFLFIATQDGKLRRGRIWDVAVALVHQIATFIGEASLRVVADAYFSKAPFINPLLKAGVHLISRLRWDAVGWDDPPPYKGRGRPPKKGEKWKLADLIKIFPPKQIQIKLYGKIHQIRYVVRDVWLRDVAKKVRVVVIQSRGNPILLLSTDLTLTPVQIITIYSSRFTLEIAIRDLKGHFGIGAYQFRILPGIIRFVHLCCISFCLWRLMMIPKNRAWMEDSHKEKGYRGDSYFSFSAAGRALKRYVVRNLIFSNFASGAELEKMEDEIEMICSVAQ